MRIIAGSKGVGKTVELLERAYLTGAVIIVANHNREENLKKIAKELKFFPQPKVMEVMEYLKIRGVGVPAYEVLIDDVEAVIQTIFREPVNMVTADLKNIHVIYNAEDMARQESRKEEPPESVYWA